MKKLMTVLVLFLLVGCSDAYANTSTNDVLFEVNGVGVTQQELFTAMKAADSGRLAIEEAQKILTQDITDEAIADEANESLARQKEDLGELFEVQLKAAGYSDENNYMERSIKPYVRLKTKLTSFLTEDYDDFAISYKPRQLQILQVATRESGKEALEKLSAGTSFEEVAEEYKEGTTYIGEDKIHLMNDTTIPTEVTNFVLESNEPTLSGLIETATGEVKFFIVKVINPDVTAIKDKAIEAGLDNSTLTQKYIAKMYKDAGFKVYDKTIYDILSKDFADYLAN